MLAVSSGRDEIEVAMIGYEGVAGLRLNTALDRTPLRGVVQIPGRAWRVSCKTLLGVAMLVPELRDRLEIFQFCLGLQCAYTALSHGSYSVVERLARWILMAHDRCDGDDLPFVHEYLAWMLAVRRSGITIAVQELEGEKAIRADRALIRVRDRDKLKALASGSYGIPEQEYERMMGIGFSKS